jgi:hypothetical protein
LKQPLYFLRVNIERKIEKYTQDGHPSIVYNSENMGEKCP